MACSRLSRSTMVRSSRRRPAQLRVRRVPPSRATISTLSSRRCRGRSRASRVWPGTSWASAPRSWVSAAGASRRRWAGCSRALRRPPRRRTAAARRRGAQPGAASWSRAPAWEMWRASWRCGGDAGQVEGGGRACGCFESRSEPQNALSCAALCAPAGEGQAAAAVVMAATPTRPWDHAQRDGEARETTLATGGQRAEPCARAA